MKINFRYSLYAVEKYIFKHNNDELLLWCQFKPPFQLGYKFRKFKRDFGEKLYFDLPSGQEKTGLCQTAEFKSYRFVLFPKGSLYQSIHYSNEVAVPLNFTYRMKSSVLSKGNPK